MSRRQVEALDVARRYLFDASEGLIKAGRLLSDHGFNADGRTASRMGTDVVAMRKRVRKAHNDALAAEGGTTATGEQR